jgi:hypothetical protein
MIFYDIRRVAAFTQKINCLHIISAKKGLNMGALRLSAFSILSVLRLSAFYLWFAWGI